jgi:hypothetical protein
MPLAKRKHRQGSIPSGLASLAKALKNPAESQAFHISCIHAGLFDIAMFEREAR